MMVSSKNERIRNGKYDTVRSSDPSGHHSGDCCVGQVHTIGSTIWWYGYVF